MDLLLKIYPQERKMPMLYLTVEDFYEKAAACASLTRQEELECAKRMKEGDGDAREQLMESYLPMVAGHIRRARPEQQTLGMVLYCLRALESAMNSFDFFQEGETFAHRLSWHLRQAGVAYTVR